MLVILWRIYWREQEQTWVYRPGYHGIHAKDGLRVVVLEVELNKRIQEPFRLYRHGNALCMEQRQREK